MDGQMMEPWRVWCYGIFFWVFGVVLLVWPRRVQRLIQGIPPLGPKAITKPVSKYIDSPLYVWNLRVTGCVSLMMGGLLIYAMCFGEPVR